MTQAGKTCPECKTDQPKFFFSGEVCIHCAAESKKTENTPIRKEKDAGVYEEAEPECLACAG